MSAMGVLVLVFILCSIFRFCLLPSPSSSSASSAPSLPQPQSIAERKVERKMDDVEIVDDVSGAWAGGVWRAEEPSGRAGPASTRAPRG